jgi:hypothetical protein
MSEVVFCVNDAISAGTAYALRLRVARNAAKCSTVGQSSDFPRSANAIAASWRGMPLLGSELC